jgi:hypothetical protein
MIMTSVTLIHPEETLTVPALQMISKCSVFEKNVTLANIPYEVQSSVSLSIFREFVSELEGNTVKITRMNLNGLEQLCEEFGFEEFSAKLSNFFRSLKDCQRQQIWNSLARVRSAHLRESILFVVTGTVIAHDFAEAAALFPAIREEHLVDGCARKFFLNENGIEGADIRSLQLFLSGETISVKGSQLLEMSVSSVSLWVVRKRILGRINRIW